MKNNATGGWWKEPETIEEAEALVLHLAQHWQAYGAMISKCREAWSDMLCVKYGIDSGAWDVTRDLALAKAEEEIKRLREGRPTPMTEGTRVQFIDEPMPGTLGVPIERRGTVLEIKVKESVALVNVDGLSASGRGRWLSLSQLEVLVP